MSTQPVILRPAEPNDEDGHSFARYVDIAAEGFFQFLLGKRYLQILAEAFKENGCSYSYANVLLADVGTQTAGMVCGFSSDQHKTFTDKPLRKAAGRSLPRMLIVKSMLGPMIRALDRVPDGDFYILSLATDTEFRGMGIGSQLLDAMEDRASKEGCERVSLDVSADNNGARKLYERRGMEIEGQWPKRMSLPKVTFFRMSKKLES